MFDNKRDVVYLRFAGGLVTGRTAIHALIKAGVDRRALLAQPMDVRKKLFQYNPSLNGFTASGIIKYHLVWGRHNIYWGAVHKLTQAGTKSKNLLQLPEEFKRGLDD